MTRSLASIARSIRARWFRRGFDKWLRPLEDSVPRHYWGTL
jgi:hypothetical protein